MDLSFSRRLAAEGITDGNQYVRIDLTTGAIETIDYAHHEIHGGSHFCYLNAWDVANAGVQDILVTTGPSALTHLVFDITCEAETDILFYKAPTITTSGRLAENPSVFNRRYDSTATASMFLYPLATLGAVGTLVFHDHIGSAKTVGGVIRDNAEHVLAANTSYLLRITNATTSANYIRAKLDWYEHVDKTAIALTD